MLWKLLPQPSFGFCSLCCWVWPHYCWTGKHPNCDFMSAPPCLCADRDPVKGSCLRQCPCHPPANPPRHNYNNCHYHDPQEEPQQHHQSRYENDSCSVCHYDLIFSALIHIILSTDVMDHLVICLHRNAPQNRQRINDVRVPPPVAPARDMLHEVSVNSPFQPGPGPDTREIRKTISLPEECSKSH